MKNPRRKSNKKILPLEECVEPFRAIFEIGNDAQPSIGGCLTLQINNNKVSYPLHKLVELPCEHYKLLKNLERAGRYFMSPNFGNYDIDKEFLNYEPRISQI